MFYACVGELQLSRIKHSQCVMFVRARVQHASRTSQSQLHAVHDDNVHACTAYRLRVRPCDGSQAM